MRFQEIKFTSCHILIYCVHFSLCGTKWNVHKIFGEVYNKYNYYTFLRNEASSSDMELNVS